MCIEAGFFWVCSNVTDLWKAFNQVIQGSKNSGESATALAHVLKDAQLAGAGASEVFLKLSENQVLLGKRVEQGTEGLKKQGVIQDGFTLKNENFGASVDKLGKKITAMTASIGLIDFGVGITNGIIKMTDALMAMPQWLDKNARLWTNLAIAALLLQGRLIAVTASSWANTTAKLAGIAVDKVSVFWTEAVVSAQAAYITVTNALTGRITLATAAQRLFNGVMMINPVGAVVAGVLALIEVIDIYRSNTKEAIQLDENKQQLTRSLARDIEFLGLKYEGLQEQVGRYNELSSASRKALIDEIENTRLLTVGKLEQAKAEQESIRARSAQVGTWEFIWNAMSHGGNKFAAIQANINDALENGDEAASVYTDGIKQLELEIKKYKDMLDPLVARQNAFERAMKINAGSITQYHEKIALLRIALEDSKLETEEYTKVLKELKKVNDEMSQKTAASGGAEGDDNSGGDDKKGKDARKFVEDTTDLMRQLRDLRIDIMDEGTEKSKEVLRAKYEDEVAATKKIIGHEKQKGEVLLQLKENLDKDLADVDKAYQERMRVQRERDAKETAKETEKIAEGMVKQIADQEKAVKKVAGVLFNAFVPQMKKATKSAAKQMEEDFKKAIHNISDALGQLSQGLGLLTDIRANEEEAAFNKEHALSEKRKELLKKELESKRISQKSYDDKLIALEEQQKAKENKFKLEAFEAQQKAARTQAIISGIQAVAQTLAAYPWPWSLIPAAGAAAIAALQVEKINSTPPPELEDGGHLAPDELHVIPGPSHKQGGIDLVEHESGNVIANMEGQEGVFIVSKDTTPEVKNVLENAMPGADGTNPERTQKGLVNVTDESTAEREQRGLVNFTDDDTAERTQKGLVNVTDDSTAEREQRGLVNFTDDGTVEREQRGLVNFTDEGTAEREQHGLVNFTNDGTAEREQGGLVNFTDDVTAEHTQKGLVNIDDDVTSERTLKGLVNITDDVTAERGQSSLVNYSTPTVKHILENGMPDNLFSKPDFSVKQSFQQSPTVNTNKSVTAVRMAQAGFKSDSGFVSGSTTNNAPVFKDKSRTGEVSKRDNSTEDLSPELLRQILKNLEVANEQRANQTTDPFAAYRNFEKVQNKVMKVRRGSIPS